MNIYTFEFDTLQEFFEFCSTQPLPRIIKDNNKTTFIPWNKGRKGHKHSDETRLKMSLSAKGKSKSAEHNEKVGNALRGRTHSAEHRLKNSIAQSQKLTCPHCNKIGGKSAMIRWHFNNCPTITQDISL